jgi:hypothetical protein
MIENVKSRKAGAAGNPDEHLKVSIFVSKDRAGQAVDILHKLGAVKRI